MLELVRWSSARVRKGLFWLWQVIFPDVICYCNGTRGLQSRWTLTPYCRLWSLADYLAVAASYTYEEGERDHPADAIYIRETTEEETKPKSG